MDDTLGEFSVTAYNLPAEARAIMESAQVRRVDDIDQLLSGLQLQTSAVDSSGAQALEAGFLVTELSAGYDGTMSRVFRAIGTRCKSGYEGADNLTYRTTIDAMDAMDGVLLGVPLRSFPAQSTIYELVDYLRQLAGLEPGNLSYPLLTALIGEAKLSSPYHVAGGQALAHLRNVLQWLPLRWFVDDRALWICGRDDVPNFNNVPAYVAGDVAEPDLLLTRPQRDDGGRVRIECLLCPRILPGHLVNLTPGGLALALQGLSPTDQQIAYAQVPPGFYRCEEVSHTGSTSDMDRWTTTALLRPGVAQDIVVL
jgi:hypothetical protein